MNWQKRIVLLLWAICCAQGIARSQTAPAYWQQQVDYIIDVSLNEEEHTLDGFLKMHYSNNSPDTLSFLWIHCWPNAYKNDRTAFSEQLLDNGRTDFYFSDKGKRGYINHLDFRVEGAVAKMEDHPRYIDIVKIILPHPLLPGAQATITTPFHVQLPFPFSGSGYYKGMYQVTQWYPQPAVYDQKGWHEMPYLDQGGAYSEFGHFDVRITLPKNYIVAATGVLADTTRPYSSGTDHQPAGPAARETQTLRFQQNNIPAFAWFANPQYRADHDTLRLPSGRVIDVYAYYTKESAPVWQHSIGYIKEAIRYRSSLIGEYPYDVASVAEITSGSPETGMPSFGTSSPGTSLPGMSSSPSSGPACSYPTLAGISTPTTGKALDLAIQHTLGRNWFQSILGTNDRTDLWLDEGLNTYYDRRYMALKYPPGSPEPPPLLLRKKTFPQHGFGSPPSHSHNTTSRNGSNTHPKTTPAHPPVAKALSPQTSSSQVTSNPDTSTAQALRQTTSGTNPAPRHKTSRHAASQTTAPGTSSPKAASKPATMHKTPPAEYQLPGWLKARLPADPSLLFINSLAAEKEDQRVSTPSDDFTGINYSLIPNAKTAIWLRQLEDSLGTSLFDASMKEYFRRWSFRHPGPADFQQVIADGSPRPVKTGFTRLDEKGPATPSAHPKKIRPAFLFSLRNTDKIEYINIGPAAGYNTYDHFMIGALIHNFDLPANAFQFALAPLYATNSHQLVGSGILSYSWFPDDRFQKIRLDLEGARFSSVSGSDSNGHKLFGGFYKIAPSLRLVLKNRSARSTVQKWVEWKTYLIGESSLTNYVQKSTDSLSYPGVVSKYQFRYLNQLSFSLEDNRLLYPYQALLQIQQGDRFYRINFTGHYFFNYAEGGGLALRFFAAKFGYLGGMSSSLDLSRYQPKLTGVSGSEDYTYSNYFVGRNDYTGLSSQQLMIRDGGLKIRVPNFPFLEGRSDNWVSALNLNSTLPSSIVPRWLPLKVFLDVGTYAAGWQADPPTSRFLYTGGLQLSLFHNVLNFYAPLIYSSDFRDQLKTIPDQNTFWKKLSFSIELQNIDWKKRAGQPNGLPF